MNFTYAIFDNVLSIIIVLSALGGAVIALCLFAVCSRINDRNES